MIKLNPAELQRAVFNLARALTCFGQSIVVTEDDIRMADEARKLRERPVDKAERKETVDRAVREHVARLSSEKSEKAASRDAARDAAKDAERDGRLVQPHEKAPPRQEQKKPKDGEQLPEKPMKLARMEEFLKAWIPQSKAKPVRTYDGYYSGAGCSLEGKEYRVKAVFGNGVALVNLRATQYHRLVRTDHLDHLVLAPTGRKGEYRTGQLVDVGYGLKGAREATCLVRAQVESIRGETANVKVLGNGALTTARLENLAPVKEQK